MIGSLIGAAIGAAIDGSDGEDSTADGALVGAVTVAVLRRAIPIGITIAGLFVVRHYARRIGRAASTRFRGDQLPIGEIA